MENKFEKYLSYSLHKKYIPVLISSRLLQTYGCGQIDIAYLKNGVLFLIEAKSSVCGIRCSYRGQFQRLSSTASFLESLLDVQVNLKYIAKRHEAS